MTDLLQERLESAKTGLAFYENRISEIEAEIDRDRAPVGTVFAFTSGRVCGGSLLAVKVRRLHANDAWKAKGPGWRTIFDDLSGSWYPSFAAVEAAYSSGMYKGATWTEVYRP